MAPSFSFVVAHCGAESGLTLLRMCECFRDIHVLAAAGAASGIVAPDVCEPATPMTLSFLAPRKCLPERNTAVLQLPEFQSWESFQHVLSN